MKTEVKEKVFSSLLMNWNLKSNKRKMPWKDEKDPYKIWLSEIILQQTRVEQGLEYYNQFIKKYPTVKKLAASTDDDVFKMWEGLGYYSRCKNLLATARYIASDLKGAFPATYNDILNLKGVGPYTAAAISSFAYELPHAVVDGNVNRLLARFFGITSAIDSTEGKKIFASLAQHLLPKLSAASYNQAIMDFGATVCKPQLPLCAACVLQKHCTAYNAGTTAQLPVKEKKLVKKHRWFYYVVAACGGNILIKRRSGQDIWQNLYEFLLFELPAHVETKELKSLQQLQDLKAAGYHITSVSKEYKQQLTHQTIHAIFIKMEAAKAVTIPGMQWVSRAAIAKLAFPRIINEYVHTKSG